MNNTSCTGRRHALSRAVTLCLTPLCITVAASQLHAATAAPLPQNVTQTDTRINGIIRDKAGKPVPGATIRVAGTNRGTTSGADGHFTINANPKGSLEVSYIGFNAQVVSINNSVELEIILEAKEGNMNEVVVVGFGQQRKISLVGAQSSIKVADLKQPVANLSTVLAGRISGIVAVQRSGEPGHDDGDIWIRGISTFTSGSTRPLVLVDGVERALSNIDPQDVESFTILKDASATAVYGVRGANGVIIVKTRSGKSGKPRINLDYNEGITRFTKVPDMADGVTYMKLANEALTTRGYNPKYTADYIKNTEDNTDPNLYPNVDWIDAIFNNTGRNRRANLNISGGSNNAKYYVSLGYYDEKGLFKTTDLVKYNQAIKYRRYNFTSNLNMRVTPTTTIDLGLQGYISNGNYPGGATAIDGNGNISISSSNIFEQALLVPPVEYPILYPGNFVPGRNPNGDQRNPYADVTRRGYTNEFKNQLYSNIRLTQDLRFIIPGLSFTSMFAFDAYSGNVLARLKREDTYVPDPATPYKADGSLNLVRTYQGTNYLSYNANRSGNRRFYTETSLNYDSAFGKHRVSGLLLYNQSDYLNPFAGDFTRSIPYRTRGIAARVTYSWNDRYFVEGNAGYNGSENFAPTQRYGLFPAWGLGWVVSNEPFFNGIKNTIPFLKFRFSDGNVGSGLLGSGDNARRFAYLTLLNEGATGYTFGSNRSGITGINVSDYAVDVTWSTARKMDLGMDLRLFNEQLSLTVDLFREHRTGIFLQRGAVPSFVGLINNPWGNLGVVDNKGLDANLEYTTKIGNLGISLMGNFTYNKDKVIENDQPIPKYPWMDKRGTNILARYGYVAEGLFTSDDEIAKSAKPEGAKVLPGDIRYRDLNGDGKIDAYDQQQIGRGDVPAIVYGFGLNLSYKQFYMSAFFQGQAKADVQLSGRGIMPFNGDGGVSNIYAIATDRWTPENPSQDVFYPRLAFGQADNYNNTLPSSWWVKDMSYIRLKSAELGYLLPQQYLRKVGITSGKIYMTGFNLLTFSDFKLWDVEMSTSNGGAYPNITTFSAGINLQF
ncbi:TonB-dependent receptor [Chitinophaga sp. sic0106]|uniref:SusC/RagA family TonB-linked outer membrane protein n=1 Tax=Chitinophaga sp. sic0106 TaxID=2854785 RepID=UPI001C4950AD|nr:TonB-dependent receptor [Chitinophaga sp. sic0106]MBV7529757.1 TonB-dependent receptor [Chitinophaga sp. sic0106]